MVPKLYLYEMGKRLKIALISLASVVVLGSVGLLIAQIILTTKIENFLSNDLPEHIKLDYETLDLSLFSGSLKITKPTLKVFGKTTDTVNLMNEMSSVVVDDISYWDYLFNEQITIEKLQINSPKITYRHSKVKDSVDNSSTKMKTNNQSVHIKNFEITKGHLSMLEVETDSLQLSINDFNVSLKDIHFDNEKSKQRIPFTYADYNVDFEDMFYSINKYDNLKVEKSMISSDSFSFSNFNLYTKYSKQKLSTIIPVERDHFNLSIANVSLHNQKFGYHKDSIFYFKSPNVVFSDPVFNIYRDKLVNDDVTIKLLYSRMLRNLNFDLTLSEVLLKNAMINYSEKVKPDSQAGEISFTKTNATIKNLGNTFSSSEKTTIDIDAVFMKSTPIKVNWYFDVTNANDQFVFKAEIGRLPAQDLNPFSEPNLKVRFEGELVKTYFTIDGNFQKSNVSLKTNYDDFKVLVLQKDGKDKNKLLSAVANLFIKKDTEKEADNFREGSKSDVERDKTKSVFNFLWLNAGAGLLSAMTGDGKK